MAEEMNVAARPRPEVGFEICRPLPSRSYTLYWNNEFAGYWEDCNSPLKTFSHWSGNDAAPNAQQRANPAWILRGISLKEFEQRLMGE